MKTWYSSTVVSIISLTFDYVIQTLPSYRKYIHSREILQAQIEGLYDTGMEIENADK